MNKCIKLLFDKGLQYTTVDVNANLSLCIKKCLCIVPTQTCIIPSFCPVRFFIHCQHKSCHQCHSVFQSQLHNGHLIRSFSHQGVIHFKWYTCPHPNRHNAPLSSKSQRQMRQVEFPSFRNFLYGTSNSICCVLSFVEFLVPVMERR